MDIKLPPKLNFAVLPTPIQYLPKISEAFGGPDIYIKRDDLTGIGLTGNKIRKLEFLFAEAKARSADIVITCGGAQSNHARATAIAAAKAGLQCHLVLRTMNSKSLDGNLFLDRLVDAEINFITEAEYDEVDAIMANMAKEYEQQGRKTYVIPEGGSNALGAYGYVAAIEEIEAQIREQGIGIDSIFLAIGSGGTHAGLLLGTKIHNVKWNIIGANVCDDAPYFVRQIGGIISAWKKKYAPALGVEKKEIQIIDGYVGKGYGLSSREELETIKQVARLEGILLDPVYTGKAMFCLKDQIRQGRIDKKSKVLFLHTGGIFGLFPKKSLFF
ncbi:MAG: D-cysteine desulfhydrase family protein [bacterium]